MEERVERADEELCHDAERLAADLDELHDVRVAQLGEQRRLALQGEGRRSGDQVPMASHADAASTTCGRSLYCTAGRRRRP